MYDLTSILSNYGGAESRAIDPPHWKNQVVLVLVLTGLPLSWGVLGMFHPGYTWKVSSRKCWKRISGRKSIDGLKKPTVTSCCCCFWSATISWPCLLSCCQAVLEWRSVYISAGHPDMLQLAHYDHKIWCCHCAHVTSADWQQIAHQPSFYPRAPEVLERPALGRLDCYPV